MDPNIKDIAIFKYNNREYPLNRGRLCWVEIKENIYIKWLITKDDIDGISELLSKTRESKTFKEDFISEVKDWGIYIEWYIWFIWLLWLFNYLKK